MQKHISFLAEILLWVLGAGFVVAAGFLAWEPIGWLLLGAVTLVLAYGRRVYVWNTTQGDE